MPKRTFVIVSIVLALLASPAVAGKINGPPGSKVAMELPTGWKVQAVGKGTEGVLVTVSPDEEASVIFAISEAANLQKAVAALDAMLGKFVKNPKTTKAGKVTINGMAGIAAKGTGTISGKAVKTGVVVLQTKGGKMLFVIGLVNAAKKDAYKATFDQVIASLEPTP